MSHVGLSVEIPDRDSRAGWLSDELVDSGLRLLLADGLEMLCCSAEPMGFEEAVFFELGSGPVSFQIDDLQPGVRRVTFGDVHGFVEVVGLATHWCVVNKAAESLLVRAQFRVPRVLAGDTFIIAFVVHITGNRGGAVEINNKGED